MKSTLVRPVDWALASQLLHSWLHGPLHTLQTSCRDTQLRNPEIFGSVQQRTGQWTAHLCPKRFFHFVALTVADTFARGNSAAEKMIMFFSLVADQYWPLAAIYPPPRVPRC